MFSQMRFSTYPWKTLLLLACAVWGASPAAWGQDARWAARMFDKDRLDFGTVARGAEVSTRIKITNPHKSAVHIAGVRTACTCAQAGNPTANTLMPGESCTIKVSIDTVRFQKQRNTNLIVTFDAPQYAEVTIPISCYIRTDVVVQPGGIDFGAVTVGAGARKTVQIQYAGRTNWTIREVVSRNEAITAELTETSRANGRVEYALTVSLASSAPLGEIREQLMLKTDDGRNPEIPITVEGRVEPEITITPAVVNLGTMTPGQRKTVNLVLRGRKPFTVDKIESETGSEAFAVKLPEKANQVHVVPLIVTAKAPDGTLDEEFTITVSGSDEPVHFKVRGRVAPATARQ